MGDIRMTAEVRSDYDCEASGIPADRWAEAVFKPGNEVIAIEVSVEKEVIIAVMVGKEAAWKGTLNGFKQLLNGE